MGIEVQWLDDDRTIICYGLQDPWNMDDLYTAIRAGYNMSKGAPAIYIIYDFSHSRHLPANFFSAVQHMRRMRQSNARERVMIGAPPFVRSMTRMFERLAPELAKGLYFVDNQAEALTYIAVQKAASDDLA